MTRLIKLCIVLKYSRSDECDVNDFQHQHFRALRHVVDLWHLGYNFLWLFSYSYYGINLLVPIHRMDQFDTYLYLLDLRCCYVLRMYALLMRNQNQLVCVIKLKQKPIKNQCPIKIKMIYNIFHCVIVKNEQIKWPFGVSRVSVTCWGLSQPFSSISRRWYCARCWRPSLRLLLLWLMRCLVLQCLLVILLLWFTTSPHRFNATVLYVWIGLIRWFAFGFCKRDRIGHLS